MCRSVMCIMHSPEVVSGVITNTFVVITSRTGVSREVRPCRIMRRA